MSSNFVQTLTSFSGADLIVNFGTRVIGELQQISWGITRQKAPIYTLGSADVRSFSRGKRGIGGSLAFATFNRDAILEEMKLHFATHAYPKSFTARGNVASATNKFEQALSMTDWNNLTSGATQVGQQQVLAAQEAGVPAGFMKLDINNIVYIDQLPPIDLTCTWANEYGQSAYMKIFDMEMLNEGSGVSIDTVVMERAMSWVGRRISPITTGVATGG